MVKKSVQCDYFVYYGAYVSAGELAAAAKRFGAKVDLYGFVYGTGLEYRRVGDSLRSAELVVGVQLDAEPAFTAFKVVHDVNDAPSLARRDGRPLRTKLTAVEEHEVAVKLVSIGILKKPEYYVLHSYTVRS